jgi:hypothetical protein
MASLPSAICKLSQPQRRNNMPVDSCKHVINPCVLVVCNPSKTYIGVWMANLSFSQIQRIQSDDSTAPAMVDEFEKSKTGFTFVSYSVN